MICRFFFKKMHFPFIYLAYELEHCVKILLKIKKIKSYLNGCFVFLFENLKRKKNRLKNKCVFSFSFREMMRRKKNKNKKTLFLRLHISHHRNFSPNYIFSNYVIILAIIKCTNRKR